ncbi:Zinc ABC transporter, periplasmic-binding protein ZnuA [Thermosulfurimonas dismutans]|uniref:Zinc ABC transporter, periplasmic-binding protein ZnuA n=1 Tax=Thermosulfurimonas dismutans TaxID=999894 RepID=A0A179D3U3_9BACT|nr:Zinc ABC transporter, periplasmic-binding protein ZnuA [Thermosulfurimonas dismutans]
MERTRLFSLPVKLNLVLNKVLLLICLFLFKAVSALGITITATNFPLYDLARRLAPEERIHLLIPPGADFHHFEPGFKDFRILYESDLILAVGTEPWLKRAELRKKTLFLTQDIEVENPHLWLDLEIVETFVQKLSRTLISLKPSEKVAFEKRAQEVLGEIENIRRELKTLATCQTKKVVILGHAALGYFLREAGLEEVALAGPHPEGEVPPRRLHETLELMKRENISVVFLLDPSFRKYLPLFQKKRRVRVFTLNPGLPLLPEDRNLDFFALLRKNLRNLKIGLCSSSLPNS